MYMQLNESFTVIREQNERIQSQNNQLMKQISSLQENLAVLTQQRFGRKTEQISQISGQLSFDLDNSCVLNEAEKTVEDGIPEEPDIEIVMIVKRRKSKGKRETDLKDIDTLLKSTLFLAKGWKSFSLSAIIVCQMKYTRIWNTFRQNFLCMIIMWLSMQERMILALFVPTGLNAC